MAGIGRYEEAWTSGIKVCECDVALTRDEKLVLAHVRAFMCACIRVYVRACMRCVCVRARALEFVYMCAHMDADK